MSEQEQSFLRLAALSDFTRTTILHAPFFSTPPTTIKMLAARTTQTLGRRAFSTTRVMRGGHYAEGPGSNIPFNPKTRFFFLRYWGFMSTGFLVPFGIAYWQLHKNKP